MTEDNKIKEKMSHDELETESIYYEEDYHEQQILYRLRNSGN